MRQAVASRAIAEPPEQLWTRLLTIARWPSWAAPVVTRATPGETAADWTLTGALGGLGYAGAFKLVEHVPGQRLYLELLAPSTPFETLIHDLELTPGNPPTLTWRVHYAVGGGPGGWLLTALATRRRLPGQLREGLGRLG